jgi:hypothetical protein
VARLREREVAWIGVEELGETEVGDFDAAEFVEEDVLGFDVTVDDAVFVGVLEGGADVAGDLEGAVGWEGR